MPRSRWLTSSAKSLDRVSPDGVLSNTGGVIRGKGNAMRTLALTAAAAAAFGMILGASPVSAADGLYVKSIDGSLAVNQPDLFASALQSAWAGGGKFCSALKSLLPTANGTVTSCTPGAYPAVEVTMSHGYPTVVFVGSVTLSGSSPIQNKTCPFTDVVNLTIETPLVAHATAVAISSIGFQSPTIEATVQQSWGAPCTDQAGSHPGGLAPVIPQMAKTAATDADLPGSALTNALAPVDGQLLQALSGHTYTVATSTGDIIYIATGSALVQHIDQSPGLHHPPGH
jgi:hypothetical protein